MLGLYIFSTSLGLAILCISLLEKIRQKAFYKNISDFFYGQRTESISVTSSNNYNYFINEYNKTTDIYKLERHHSYLQTIEFENEISIFTDWYNKLLNPIFLAFVSMFVTFTIALATISSKETAFLEKSISFISKSMDTIFGPIGLMLLLVVGFLFVYVTAQQIVLNKRKRLLQFHISVIKFVLDQKKQQKNEVVQNNHSTPIRKSNRRIKRIK